MGDERLAAFGDELIGIHRWLRGELAELRGNVERYLSGRGGRPRELKAHCLAFCSALDRHHNGEDAGAFPVLAQRFPELRPVIDKLAEDHQLVAGLLRQLDQILVALPAEPDTDEAKRVLGELDGLAAIVESHFSFEERTIITALNSLSGVDGTTEELFGIDNGAR